MGIPGYVPIVAGLSLLVLMLILRARLWVTLLATSALIAFLSSGLRGLLHVFASVDRVTVYIVAVSFLIAVFVELYRRSRGIEGIGEELTKLLKRPTLIVTVVPAVLGLLPVAGGALLSIPIVDNVGDSLGLDRARKLFVNVWYRHLILLVYPLSTSLIMASLLSGVDLWSMVVRQLPVALAMSLIGFAIGIPRGGGKMVLEVRGVDSSRLLRCFAPMVCAIATSLSLSALPIARSGGFGRISMVIGICVGIALVLMLLSRDRLGDLVESIRSRSVAELVLAAYGALSLRRAFEVAGLPRIASAIAGYAPTTMITVLIPFTISLALGSPASGVMLSFPVLRGLMHVDASTASLAYVSAFLGYVGSPTHLCYVYTAQYLRASYLEGYRYMAPAIVASLAIAVALYEVLHI